MYAVVFHFNEIARLQTAAYCQSKDTTTYTGGA